MPQFIYRIQPTRLDMLSAGLTEDEAQVVGEHFTYLEELTEQGIVLMAGRTLIPDEQAFGIVVFEAESEVVAKEIMVNDPAVVKGVMRAEIWPFRVALWSAQGPRGQEKV